MTDRPGDTAELALRVRVILALTEANSRHVSISTRRAGAEIALLQILDEAPAPTPDLADRIALLRHDLEAIDEDLRAIEEQRARLERRLGEIDGTAWRHTERQGP